jgi:hypothetical protein
VSQLMSLSMGIWLWGLYLMLQLPFFFLSSRLKNLIHSPKEKIEESHSILELLNLCFPYWKCMSRFPFFFIVYWLLMEMPDLSYFSKPCKLESYRSRYWDYLSFYHLPLCYSQLTCALKVVWDDELNENLDPQKIYR